MGTNRCRWKMTRRATLPRALSIVTVPSCDGLHIMNSIVGYLHLRQLVGLDWLLFFCGLVNFCISPLDTVISYTKGKCAFRLRICGLRITFRDLQFSQFYAFLVILPNYRFTFVTSIIDIFDKGRTVEIIGCCTTKDLRLCMNLRKKNAWVNDVCVCVTGPTVERKKEKKENSDHTIR